MLEQFDDYVSLFVWKWWWRIVIFLSGVSIGLYVKFRRKKKTNKPARKKGGK